MKPIIFCAVLAIAVAMNPAAQATDFNYDGQAGIVYMSRAGVPVFEIPVGPGGQPVLEPGTAIEIVTFTSSGQRLLQARVASGPVRLGAAETRVSLPEAGPADSYTLTGVDNEAVVGNPWGVGIANADDRCRASGEAVHCDLEADSPVQSFRLCASREGLHFSIWSGEPLEGEQRWRAYYYVGYDLEPDCTEQDFPR